MLALVLYVPLAWASCNECPDGMQDIGTSNGVAIWTDDTKFDPDSVIFINGYTQNTGNEVTILVLNPMGNIAAVEQVYPDQEGMFRTNMQASGPYWKTEGTYTITARAGPDSTPHTIRVLIGQCGNGFVTLDAGVHGSHCMQVTQSGGAVPISAQLHEHTIIMTVDGTDDGILTVQIPRYLLDSKNGDFDAPFAVTDNNDVMVPFQETQEDTQMRTIRITYPPAEYGEVRITGTHAIPEFDAIILVLAASVPGILAARHWLSK